MDERARFIVECVRDELSMTELCRRYEISRKTGYKWWARFAATQRLVEGSRVSHTHPNATAEAVVAILVATRKAHPTWGPRKVRAFLARRYPRLVLPAPSTVGVILTRAGLTRPRRARYRTPAYRAPFVGCTAPNAVWCADFKGAFTLRNGRRCTPLTMSDAYSRYLLRCEALTRPDDPTVRPIFESAFCEFGLPGAIRTDNGAPFATLAPGGLSRLAVWWIKLGIRPERIARGKPQQNGRHERLHRTLREEAVTPPARDARAQQGAFDRFRRLYNDERPHEALGQQPPAGVYTASARRYTGKLREPDYPATFAVRRVYPNGTLKWGGTELYVTQTLAGEPVGLEEITADTWRVYFAHVPLGLIVGRRFRRETGASGRKETIGPEGKVSPMRPV
jgi:transposase InsO family protein